MSHQIAISGGGFRSCSSAAVMSTVLHDLGVWGSAEKIMGVSGGAWFLIALTRGKLRNVPSMSVDQVIAALKEAGILRQLSSSERTLLKYSILRGLAEVAQTCTSTSPTTPVSAYFLKKTDATPEDCVSCIPAAVAKDLDKLIDRFGTGASVAVSPYPVDNWAEFLRTHLVGEDGVFSFLSGDMTNFTARALPASTSMFAYATSVNQSGSLSWLEIPVAADDDSHLTVQAFSTQPPNSAVSAVRSVTDSVFRLATLRHKQPAALKPDDQSVTLAKNGAGMSADFMAAMVGSAFAFDLNFIASMAGVSALWSTEPVLPCVEAKVSVRVGDAEKFVIMSARDAGFAVNVPYLRCTRNCGVLWVLDSSEGSAPETELKRAVDAGHMPPLDLYTEVPVTNIGTLARDMAGHLDKDVKPSSVVRLYELTGTPPSDATYSSPRRVAILMGLTDTATMEVPHLLTRENNLKTLAARTRVAVRALLLYFASTPDS